jgi:multidrug efflux system membrane fusion protein
MPILTAITTVVLTGLAMVLNGCSKSSAGATAMQMPPPAVQVVPAVARDVPVYLDEIGKTTASEYVSITPQVAGQIMERDFVDGADIKQGQTLFVLDRRPYQAALDQAKAMLAQNLASVEFAKIEFDRMEGLIETKAVSKEDYDTKKNNLDVANAQVKASEAAVEAAQVNLDFCTIKSPIDGRAGARLVDVGNVVKSDEGSLVVIQKLDPIYADFTITERDLPDVQKNMANGTLKTLVKLPSDSGDGREGDLTFLDNAVQDGSGTVKLRATLSNPDHHFWPGQFVNVRLILSIQKNAAVVPAEAIQLGQQGSYVYVVKDNTTAELHPVTLGQKQGDMVVIEKGVSAGDPVITVGQLAVVPGAPVTVLPPAPAGDAGSGAAGGADKAPGAAAAGPSGAADKASGGAAGGAASDSTGGASGAGTTNAAKTGDDK